ncbi:hypothetical protein JW992_09055 [candidate division KSB1 bacterium]|nr:hypothetical protein [candidate division KSB1 bacterium]
MESNFSEQERSILCALAYFDLFDYPLTNPQLAELVETAKGKDSDFLDSLNSLMLYKLIDRQDEWIFLRGRARCIAERMKRARRAEELLLQASGVAQNLCLLPFIRGIYLSGDLSKGVATENSDIDFFVITAPNRVYVAKFFLALYRRIPRFNPHKLLCFNYLLSEESLQLSPEDRYIASEITFLAVLHNPELLQRFLQANGWVADFYPGYQRFSRISLIAPTRLECMQKWVEVPLRTPLGTLLDRILWLIWRGTWFVRYRRDRRRRLLLLGGTQHDRCKAHSDATHFKVLSAFRKRLRQIGVEE